LHRFIVDAALAWAAEPEHTGRGQIIWCEHEPLAQQVALAGGFPMYGEGADAGTATARTIVCMERSQGEGKNLQTKFSRSLLLLPPQSGSTFEQVVGRTHRSGQTEDEVLVDWFCHHPSLEECMKQVRRDAEYATTAGQRHKILVATVLP
jgi:hypothetical protein